MKSEFNPANFRCSYMDIMISLYSCGTHCFDAGAEIKGFKTNAWTLVYISEGKGTVKTLRRTVKLKAKQLLCVFPNDTVSFTASEALSFTWVSFAGDNAEYLINLCGFGNVNPLNVGTEISKIFSNIANVKQSIAEFLITSEVYKLLGILTLKNINFDKYADKVIGGIKHQINMKINTLDKDLIADALSRTFYNRAQLEKIFKRETGQTLRQYILKVKMTHAAKLLTDPAVRICQVANSIGYDDPLYFSRAFNRFYGVSPKEYRKNILENT